MNLAPTEPEVCNARIARTYLGREDHGVFTAFVDLDYGNAGQGFGNFALDMTTNRSRIGTAFGMEFIIRTVETVGAKSWEDLPGKMVRVKRTYDKVHEIGHILEDRWFNPSELFKEMVKPEKGVV